MPFVPLALLLFPLLRLSSLGGQGIKCAPLCVSTADTAKLWQNYMVVQVTLPGINNLRWRFWIIWAIICFSFIPITYFFYPETANRTLEDIDRFFESHPGIFVAPGNRTATQLARPVEYIEADERIARMTRQQSYGGQGEAKVESAKKGMMGAEVEVEQVEKV